MVEDMKLIAIVLILAALAYILYLWSKRKDQIPCPSCGARVNIYAEECPHCGHRKGEPVEEESEDMAEDLAEEPATTPAEEPADAPQPAAASTDTDYDAVVRGTIPEVKHQVMEEELDPQKVLEAEESNKDRVTLKDWLNEQLAQQ